MGNKINRARGASRRTLVIFLVALIGGGVPLSLYGWKIAYRKYFETTAPTITTAERAYGVGVTPTTLHIKIGDEHSGIQKVLIRYQQNITTPPKELLKKTLSGANEDTVALELDHKKLGLSEGPLTIFIKVIDKSLWSNTTEKKLSLAVDFKPPKLSAFTTMHNERAGGSELIFYRATDANLGDSGVIVQGKKFIGTPARFFSPTLRDDALYATLYALPWDGEKESSEEPKLFATDAGENIVLKPFPQKLFDRKKNRVRVTLSKEFIEKRMIGGFLTQNNSTGDALNAAYRALQQDDETIRSKVIDTRLDKYFTGALKLPGGAVQTSFGDELTFLSSDGNEALAAKPLLMKGFELRYSSSSPIVTAAADGIVLSSEALTGYGRVIVIDHGLGLTTVYARLDEALVHVGDKISQGTQIGVAGKSGFSRVDGPQCYFEVRIHGEPVDPREWIDEAWVYGHITKQGEDAEKAHEIYFGGEES